MTSPTTLATPRASLSADGRAVSHSRGGWSEVFPAEDLPGRIAFYRERRDAAPPPDWKGRHVGWHAETYGPHVVALERVQKLAIAMGGKG